MMIDKGGAENIPKVQPCSLLRPPAQTKMAVIGRIHHTHRVVQRQPPTIDDTVVQKMH